MSDMRVYFFFFNQSHECLGTYMLSKSFCLLFLCVCVCVSVFRTQKVKHFAMQKWECHCATLSVFFSACPCKCDHAELYTSCLHIACVCACMGAWVRAWACVCVAIMCFLVFISKNMSEVAFFASSITVHTFQRIDMHTCACVCVCVWHACAFWHFTSIPWFVLKNMSEAALFASRVTLRVPFSASSCCKPAARTLGRILVSYRTGTCTMEITKVNIIVNK